jgi:type II secretory pathway pseudopilin PulG
MMRSRSHELRRGFTLLEILVVMASLGLVLLLIAAALVGAMQAQQTALKSSQQLISRSALADQFRSDVGRAAAAPEKLGDQAAGPQCLILKMADDRHVVYRWREGRLERSETAGEVRSSRVLPVGDAIVAVEFGRSDGSRISSLRLIERLRPEAEKHVIEYVAALGGDRQ